MYVLLFRHQLLLRTIVFNTLPMGGVPKPNLQTTKIPPPQQASNQTTTTKSQNYATATNLNLVFITEMEKKKKVARRTEFFSKNKWIAQTVRLTRDGM